jgi:hypothetical protein
MCFSATASFSLAATTAVIGLATLRHVKHPHEYLLAITPLLFASQQAVEGFLWLQFSEESGSVNGPVLSFIYLVFAEVLWPTYSALAVLLIEPDQGRRWVLRAIAVIGFILSIYLLAGLLGDPPIAFIRNHSIAYASGLNSLTWDLVPYILCTCAPLLVSSHRAVQVFGAAVFAGFLVSAYAYLMTFTSVWCFFAAAGSVLLYFYFRHAAIDVGLRHARRRAPE